MQKEGRHTSYMSMDPVNIDMNGSVNLVHYNPTGPTAQDQKRTSLSGAIGATVSFHDLVYTVRIPVSRRPPCVKQEKQILHGVR